jgi:branched-chain amino acid transport system permease protein
MTTILEVLVFGLQAGAVYSLVALGVALVYKATRILNFAQGELGTVSAFVAYVVMTGFQVAGDPEASRGRLWLATLVALVVGAGLGVLINTLVIRRLAAVSAVTSLVATAGLTLLSASVAIIFFEAKVRRYPQYVRGGFEFPGTDVNVSWQTIVTVFVLAVAAALLALLFRTPPGVALLATAQEPFAAELQGVSVNAMRTMAWALAGVLGALGGLLGGGVFATIQPGFMTGTFLIPALTGAVLGGLTSMVGAVSGGLILGIVVSAANQINSSFELGIPGPPQAAAFAVLLIVLLVRPRGLFGQEA